MFNTWKKTYYDIVKERILDENTLIEDVLETLKTGPLNKITQKERILRKLLNNAVILQALSKKIVKKHEILDTINKYKSILLSSNNIPTKVKVKITEAEKTFFNNESKVITQIETLLKFMSPTI